MYIKEKQNIANKKWRELNPEKWKEINNLQQKIWYDLHKEQKSIYKKKKYIYDKESKLYLNILLE